MKHFVLGCISTLIFIPIAALVFLKLGLYPVNADTKPWWLEKKLAHMAVEAHVESQASSLTNPLSVTQDTLMAGMKGYQSNCSGCHGSPTKTDSTFSDAFYPRAPRFGLKGLKHDLRETFWVTKHGIRMSGMPAFTTMLTDDEMWQIAVFIANIDKLPPTIAPLWQSPNK